MESCAHISEKQQLSNRHWIARVLRSSIHFGIRLSAVIMISVYLVLSSKRLQSRAELYASRSDGILVQNPLPSVALVTLADPNFLNCTAQLAAAARSHGWQQPIFVLAVNGTRFDDDLLESLDKYGVQVIHTSPALDEWIDRSTPRMFQFRQLEAVKFRKMEIFFNPMFRTFERIIYMDPDGYIGASLDPLVFMSFPLAVSVLLRQNDASFGKLPLWESELAPEALRLPERQKLRSRYPNRDKVGATSWFLVNTRTLSSPDDILRQSRYILELYKPAFRLNDQTLINLLFYNRLELIPWCAWDEVHIISDSIALRSYCIRHMEDQRHLGGRLTFIYRHMSPAEKIQCVLTT
jgi:hypothetical protein